MSRLDDIIDRNKNPGKHGRKGVTMGLLISAFVFLILVLVIFTDFEDAPNTPAPAPTAGEKHVDGVLIYRERPAVPHDAGRD